MLPSFRENIALRKAPRIRPFVLLVRATCWWKWDWVCGKMILAGKIEALCTTFNTHGLTWDCARDLAVRGKD